MNLQSKILQVISEVQGDKMSKKIIPTHALDKDIKEKLFELGYSLESIENEIIKLESSNIVKTGDTINYRYIEIV